MIVRGEDSTETYRRFVEANKSVEDFCNDRRPRSDVFGLRVSTQFVEVLEDTHSQPEGR